MKQVNSVWIFQEKNEWEEQKKKILYAPLPQYFIYIEPK